MPAYFLFILLLLPSSLAASTVLENRLAAAASAPDDTISALFSNNSKLTVENMLVLTEAYITKHNKDAALELVNKALAETTTPYITGYAYLIKARVYGILFRDTEFALTQLELAEQQVKPLEDKAARQLYSHILVNYASAYNQLGLVQQAIPYAEQALALATELNIQDNELKARIMLGRLALQNNHYSYAYQHFVPALNLARQLNDQDALASIHLRLGMAYRKLQEYPLALEHMQQAADWYKQENRLSNYSYALVYIAETYTSIGTAEKLLLAEPLLQEALAIGHQLQNPLRVAVAKQALARIAISQEQPEKALQYYNETIQLARQQNLSTTLYENTIALANFFVGQQKLPEAAALLARLPAENIEQTAVYLQHRYYDAQARLAVAQQKWQPAYQAMQLAGELRFKELSDQYTEQLELIKNNLQQLSEKDILQQQLAIQQQKSQQQQQRMLLFIAVLILLLLALLSVVIYYHIRQNRLNSRDASLQSYNWVQFCQRMYQEKKRGKTLYLLAFSLKNPLDYKQRYSETALEEALEQQVSQLTRSSIIHSMHSDTLWLGVSGSEQQASALAQQVAEYFLQKLTFQLPQAFISLLLSLDDLLGQHWQKQGLTAIREVVWLSWKLAEYTQPTEKHWQLQITPKRSRPFEWHDSNIRQDMLNAISLGDIQLSCNQQVVPANLAERLQTTVATDNALVIQTV